MPVSEAITRAADALKRQWPMLAREDTARQMAKVALLAARRGAVGMPVDEHDDGQTDRTRLRALAIIVIDYLDGEMEAADVDEWDESDPRCYVYNAAHAVLERDTPGGGEHMDRELFEQLASIAAEDTDHA